MKRYLSLVLLLTLSACGLTCPPMTFCDYAEVEIGTPIADIEACYGCPFHHCCEGESGESQYVYIERIELLPGHPEQHDYIFTVKDGVIIKKCYEFHEHAFEFEHSMEPLHHLEDYRGS